MDVISMGEMLIDFTPGKEKNSYIKNPGGAPANAAVSIARNGLKVGFLGKLGEDDFGRFLRETLEEDGVTYLCEGLTKEAVTTLAFVTLYENGERSFTFARKPGADMMLYEWDVKEEDIAKCRLFHAGSFSLSENPSRDAVKYAMKMAHEQGKLVSFDVNYRDMVWESKEAAKNEVDKVLPYIDLLKISDEELYFVGGEENIFRLMDEYDITVVIETLGAKGAKYFFRKEIGKVEGRRVHAVDATGAGDAFFGGFLSKLLLEDVNKKQDLTKDIIEAALKYGNISGSLCVQKMGGIPALPTREEIEKVWNM
ncbi:carbohydrate kinase [Anaerocolumna aminovalerica]|uniref:Fructokinase n=1 Tax=Anaerocolumna aminovalerica TaxID=1527 RepID=A0A1I5BSW6_9FIRM|nr:carbohydrate kinase [Anaerocolumna aminovalerica]SFN77806.1 fructokinase [Anaerocolumna aminovalerica]